MSDRPPTPPMLSADMYRILGEIEAKRIQQDRARFMADQIAARNVTVTRYEAVWDPMVYTASRPWHVFITTLEHGIYGADGSTEGEAMMEAFRLMPTGH